MTQQTIPVTPNVVTTVNVQLAVGATLYNTDTVNAVYVATSPGVSPSTGIRIGPRGSLQWTTDKAPCYACLDTGATVSVPITVSTDTANPVNPIDVATAVATALLAQGIPSVFLGNSLGSGGVMPILGGSSKGYLSLDVSKYASVIVYLFPSAVTQISATFHDTSAGNNLGSFDFPYTNTAGGGIAFTLPVTGPLLDLVMNGTGNTSVHSIYGSNRSVPAARVFTGYSVINTWDMNMAFTFGVNVNFPSMPAFISNGKPCYLRMVVTGAGKGLFGYSGFSDFNATVNQIDLVDSATGVAGSDGTEIEKTIILPPGKLALHFAPRFTGTYDVRVALVQEQ